MSCSKKNYLYIKNIPNSISESEIKGYISQYERVTDYTVIFNNPHDPKNQRTVKFWMNRLSHYFKVLDSNPHRISGYQLLINPYDFYLENPDILPNTRGDADRVLLFYNVPYTMPTGEIKGVFCNYGEVEWVDMRRRDDIEDISQNYGYCIFKRRNCMQMALEQGSVYFKTYRMRMCFLPVRTQHADYFKRNQSGGVGKKQPDNLFTIESKTIKNPSNSKLEYSKPDEIINKKSNEEKKLENTPSRLNPDDMVLKFSLIRKELERVFKDSNVVSNGEVNEIDHPTERESGLFSLSNLLGFRNNLDLLSHLSIWLHKYSLPGKSRPKAYKLVSNSEIMKLVEKNHQKNNIRFN